MMKRKGLKSFLALILVVVEVLAIWKGWRWIPFYISVPVAVLAGFYLVLKRQERKIRAEYDEETGEEDGETKEISRRTRWPYVVAAIIIIIATIAAFMAWIFEAIYAMTISCAVAAVSIGSIIIKVRRHNKDKKQEEPKKIQPIIVSENTIESCYRDFMTQ